MTETLRLLILEDTPSDAELAERELLRAGMAFESRRVDSREDFMEQLREFRPDLIVSDYSLPAFDGMTALGLAREHAPQVPVVMFTGTIDEETAVECIKAGAADYVLKDRPARLASAVQTALKRVRCHVDREEAESNLQASEQRWHAVVESANDAIVAADASGVINSWNRSAESLFGYRADEAIGESLTLIIPERFRELHTAEWGNSIATERPTVIGRTIEVAAVRKDGSELPVELSLGAWENDGGRLYTAIIRDISERKAARVALEELSGLYDLILNSVGEGIFGMDETGKTTFVNPAARRLLGWTAGELLGRSAHEAFHQCGSESDAVPASDCQILAAMRDGTTYRGHDDRFFTSSGTTVQVDWVSTPMEVDGSIVGAVVTFSDVTSRRAAEASLRKSEAEYRGLVENATYGIYRSHPTKGFLTVNSALVAMLGYGTAEELLDVSLETELYVKPSDRNRLLEKFRNSDRVDGVEVDWTKKDGSRITVRLSGRILHSDEGSVEGFEMIAADVTDRRKLESQLRQAQKMEAVGRLTGGIAHDFNNLLSVILANTQILLPDAANLHGFRAGLAEIEGAASRAAAMVKQLLGFSRHADLSLTATDLGAVVDEVASLLQRLLPADIEVKLHAPERASMAVADAGAVEQILLNLATNARDAMPDGGGLTIEVNHKRLREADKWETPWVVPGEYVCVAVTDTGFGMDKTTAAMMFEPFFTTKPPGVGTGLGMAMVYGLMKQHSGFVHAYSEPNKGTTIKLYFPASQTEAKAEASTSACLEQCGGTETILLVEDEEALRRTGQLVLERLGYSVITAADGADALKQYEADSSAIDLIISDVVMPKMGGQDLLKELRLAGDDVPFILASGYRECDTQERAAIALTVPYLQKPWTVQELAHQVRSALDESPLQGVIS